MAPNPHGAAAPFQHQSQQQPHGSHRQSHPQPQQHSQRSAPPPPPTASLSTAATASATTPRRSRQSMHPSAGIAANDHPAPLSASTSTVHRNRQYTHLHAQLAQLNAHVADLENLVGMTAVQAEYVRGLGGWWGGAYMAASKILGEETANGAGAGVGVGTGQK